MSIDRRSFLKNSAVLTIALANGKLGQTFAQVSPEYPEGPGFEPWKNWHADDNSGPLALVDSAILSSNAFNTQPWLFKVSRSGINLYADRQRNLGAFDPYLRELHFSLGCALENLLITAHAKGYDATLTLVPGKLDRIPSQPEPMLVAAVNLAPGKPREDELYNAIPHRHTNRDPFMPGKALDINFLADLRRLREDDVKLFIFTAGHDRRELVKLIVDSASLMTDANVKSGTRPWLRMTMEEWQRSRDGVYMGPSSSFKAQSLDEYATLMMSGPLFGVIAVRDRYDRRQTIRAGRLWQRAHLLATARKIAARPANGAVEMIDHERALMQEPTAVRRIAKITGDENWQPTFMFYMGYPTVQAEASARRAPREVLL